MLQEGSNTEQLAEEMAWGPSGFGFGGGGGGGPWKSDL